MMRRNVLLTALGMALALGLGGAASAAGARSKNPPPAVAKDWADGTWVGEIAFFQGVSPDGSGAFDPTKPKPNPVPLNPEYQALYDKYQAAAMKGDILFDPSADCTPIGLPAILTGFPFELMFRDGAMFQLFDQPSSIRRIFTDGRKAPPADELDPTYYGFSTGYWEGETLVIDTVGIKGDRAIDPGVPHSDQLSVHETWRKVGPDVLRMEAVVTDPGALTRPWHIAKNYTRDRSVAVEENVCSNNRNPRIGNRTLLVGPNGEVLYGK